MDLNNHNTTTTSDWVRDRVSNRIDWLTHHRAAAVRATTSTTKGAIDDVDPIRLIRASPQTDMQT